MTLFEVLLALAIFAGSIAAIGQMMSNGMRGAVQARMQSQAIIRCQAKMAEVVSGITPLQAVNKVPFPDDAAWTWSLATAAATQPNLYTLELTVEHASQSAVGEVAFTLRRMARDPQLATTALLDEQAQAAAEAANPSSSSGSSGTSTSGSTGSGSSSSGSSGSSSSGSSSSSSGKSGSGSSNSGSSNSGSSNSGSSNSGSSGKSPGGSMGSGSGKSGSGSSSQDQKNSVSKGAGT